MFTSLMLSLSLSVKVIVWSGLKPQVSHAAPPWPHPRAASRHDATAISLWLCPYQIRPELLGNRRSGAASALQQPLAPCPQGHTSRATVPNVSQRQEPSKQVLTFLTVEAVCCDCSQDGGLLGCFGGLCQFKAWKYGGHLAKPQSGRPPS